MSLRHRLNLAIASSMFLIVAAGIVFTVFNARQAVEHELRSSVRLAMQSVEAAVDDAMHNQDPFAYWQTRLGVYEYTRHLQVHLETGNGQVIQMPQAMDEAHQPAAPDWFAWWVRPEPWVETREIATDDDIIKISIHADPDDEITEAWGEARGFFGLVILQAILVFSLVHLAVGRALRSVPVILRGLEGLQAGDYRQRLPDFALPEFSRISQAFNHAASSLEKAHRDNRALAHRTLSVQEEERHTLARELHDELGQSLTGIKVIAASVSKENPNNRTAVDSISTICDHLFRVVRSMMRRLRPTMLDDLGLAASLEDMIDNWQEQNQGVSVDLAVDDQVETCGSDTQIHLFRIVQESLSNVARHARADRLAIELEMVGSANDDGSMENKEFEKCPRWVRLNIADNGRGFAAEKIESGFGLLGMRERAESLGGRFLLQTRPGQGVSITVLVPCGEYNP